MSEEYWTTKDGTEIAVGEMSEAHVKNTLRMILRNVKNSADDWEDDFWADIYRYGTGED